MIELAATYLTCHHVTGQLLPDLTLTQILHHIRQLPR